MINEEKFRAKLRELLKRPHYSNLPSFAVDPLIDGIVEAMKNCETVPRLVEGDKALEQLEEGEE